MAEKNLSPLKHGFKAFNVKCLFSIAMFGGAAALLYLLTTIFPLEMHLYVAACLITWVLLRQVLLLRNPTEHRLRQAFDELKRMTGLGAELKLNWMPKADTKLSGEVVNNTVYVYEEEFEKALETLVEEFVEYAVAEASKPYLSVINALLKHLNEEAYHKRDKVAKGLSKPLLRLISDQNLKSRKQNVESNQV
ncbi:MAG: hypothetical protein QXN87_05450 [Candidatus Bathyarchaeia archaeon]